MEFGDVPSEARSWGISEPLCQAEVRAWRKYVIKKQDRQCILHFCEAKYRLSLIRWALCAFLEHACTPPQENASCQTSPRDAPPVGESVKQALSGGHADLLLSANNCSCTKEASQKRIQPAGSGAASTSRPPSSDHADVKNECDDADSGDKSARRPRFRHPRLPPVPPIRGTPIVKDDVINVPGSGHALEGGRSLDSKMRLGLGKAREIGTGLEASKSLGCAKDAAECVPGKAEPGDNGRNAGWREDRRRQREKLLHKVEAMESKLLREISALDAQVCVHDRCRGACVPLRVCAHAVPLEPLDLLPSFTRPHTLTLSPASLNVPNSLLLPLNCAPHPQRAQFRGRHRSSARTDACGEFSAGRKLEARHPDAGQGSRSGSDGAGIDPEDGQLVSNRCFEHGGAGGGSQSRESDGGGKGGRQGGDGKLAGIQGGWEETLGPAHQSCQQSLHGCAAVSASPGLQQSCDLAHHLSRPPASPRGVLADHACGPPRACRLPGSASSPSVLPPQHSNETHPGALWPFSREGIPVVGAVADEVGKAGGSLGIEVDVAKWEGEGLGNWCCAGGVSLEVAGWGVSPGKMAVEDPASADKVCAYLMACACLHRPPVCA